jgi:hypothetical protein
MAAYSGSGESELLRFFALKRKRKQTKGESQIRLTGNQASRPSGLQAIRANLSTIRTPGGLNPQQGCGDAT